MMTWNILGTSVQLLLSMILCAVVAVGRPLGIGRTQSVKQPIIASLDETLLVASAGGNRIKAEESLESGASSDALWVRVRARYPIVLCIYLSQPTY